MNSHLTFGKKLTGSFVAILLVTLGLGIASLNANWKTASELAQSAEQICSAAGQVASSSQSLAQGASEQAASLEQTFSSTEEITSMTRKNAENSQSAAGVMATVDQQVQHGNQTLEQMVRAGKYLTFQLGKDEFAVQVLQVREIMGMQEIAFPPSS